MNNKLNNNLDKLNRCLLITKLLCILKQFC